MFAATCLRSFLVRNIFKSRFTRSTSSTIGSTYLNQVSSTKTNIQESHLNTGIKMANEIPINYNLQNAKALSEDGDIIAVVQMTSTQSKWMNMKSLLDNLAVAKYKGAKVGFNILLLKYNA